MLCSSRNPARWRVLARCTTKAHHTARSSRRRPLTTLAIESSCDDTGVAILTRNHDGSLDSKSPTHSLLFNEFISSDHREFRGIEPMVAAHALTPRLVSALGMKPAADTGSNMRPGRGSKGTNKQQTSNSSTSPEFPFLSLLVSGGHTQLVYSKSLADHRIVASTLDMYTGGWHTDLDVLAISKWPMDPDRGEGIMGAPGWLKR
ncbi:unnamed protein product [Clonostachys rosea f. rosea IK726]|uniref:Uncharacterized protein n=1 Tax=Clonostachys rosea f. rosea IK726 TaxID=1349383 RepID=A0ACA9TAC9_BIOOC|nr:unnamed protein product [Clonostachys rosea f. rosea IK726]